MSKPLSFVIAPKVEAATVGRGEITGTLYIPIHLGLSLRERYLMREVDRTDEVFLNMSALAVHIAKEESIDELDAYRMVNRVLGGISGATVVPTPEESRLGIVYAAQFQELSKLNQDNEEGKAVRACTILITERLEGHEDWTDENSQRLHEDLIADFYALYIREERKLTKPLDTEKELATLNEQLGKLRLEPGSRHPSPTGSTASGFASEPTQETQISVESDSPASALPTSSRPVKKQKRQSSSD
jgi:hypothetical protein